jgi:hypothetical protein
MQLSSLSFLSIPALVALAACAAPAGAGVADENQAASAPASVEAATWFAVGDQGDDVGLVARSANEEHTPCAGAGLQLTCGIARVDLSDLGLDDVRDAETQDAIKDGSALVKGTIAFGPANPGGGPTSGIARVLHAEVVASGFTTFRPELGSTTSAGGFFRVQKKGSVTVATKLNTHEAIRLANVSFEGIDCPTCDATTIESADDKIDGAGLLVFGLPVSLITATPGRGVSDIASLHVEQFYF